MTGRSWEEEFWANVPSAQEKEKTTFSYYPHHILVICQVAKEIISVHILYKFVKRSGEEEVSILVPFAPSPREGRS